MVTVQVCVMYTSFHCFSIFFFSRIFSAEKTVRFFHLFPVLFRRAALLSVRVSNNAQATLAPFRGTPRTRTHDANTYQLPRSASIYLLVSSSRRVPRRRFSLSSSPPPPVVTRDRLAGVIRGRSGGSFFAPAIVNNISSWEHGNAIPVAG